MKKDNIRDYAIDAFRFYASMHCKPTKQDARFALQRKHLTRGRKKADVRAATAQLNDLYAVVDTIKAIRCLKEADDIMYVFETVYLSKPDEELGRGEVENRILYVSYKTNISTATAYRYLALCRRMFAEARGLRCAA